MTFAERLEAELRARDEAEAREAAIAAAREAEDARERQAAADAGFRDVIARRAAIESGVALEAWAVAQLRDEDAPSTVSVALAVANVQQRLDYPTDPLAVSAAVEADPRPVPGWPSLVASARMVLGLQPEWREAVQPDLSDDELLALAAQAPAAAAQPAPVPRPAPAAAPARHGGGVIELEAAVPVRRRRWLLR
jgi:hypothetical protein